MNIEVPLILELGILFVTIISVFVAVRMGLAQVIKDVAELKGKTEAKDADHDTKLANHDKRLAVLESKFDTVIKEMRENLKDIYQKLIG